MWALASEPMQTHVVTQMPSNIFKKAKALTNDSLNQRDDTVSLGGARH